jgi:hypothetical protein
MQEISALRARALFRLAQIVSFMPLLEFLFNRTGWSVIPICAFYIWLLFSFKCHNCGVKLIDRKVSSKIGNSLDFIDKCPNCLKRMR